MAAIQLCEDDIPGSSLGNREPSHLTNRELVFWLSCRGLNSSKLKTKAALVARVTCMKDENLPLVDPTTDQQYLKRKREAAGLPTSTVNKNQPTVKIPSVGWTKSLNGLPDYTDINIRSYAMQSGKKVNRENSNIQVNVSQQTCERPETRGYNFFAENYVHDVWFCVEGDLAYVKAKCFHSQRTKEKPHNLWCAISCKQPSETIKAFCGCIAGASGFCNHVFGLLYQISHFSKSGKKQILPDISKTSVPQIWDKPRVLGISSEPVMSVIHHKATSMSKKRKVIQSSLYEARSEQTIPNDSKRLSIAQQQIRDVNPLIGMAYMATADTQETEYIKNSMGNFVPVGSVLSYQLAITEANFQVSYNEESVEAFPCTYQCKPGNFPNLPIDQVQSRIDTSHLNPGHKALVDDIMISQEESIKLEEETRDQSSSEIWWEARHKRLTASKFSDIAKQRSKETKLASRLVESTRNDPVTAGMQHGSDYEDTGAREYDTYMRKVGHSVEVLSSGLVVSPSFPYLGASPDRKIVDLKAHPHFGLAEVKCPYKHRNVTPFDAALADKDFCCEIRNKKMFLKKKHKHYFQIQGQMAITGMKWCDFIVYTFKGMHIERIYFDSEFWSNVLVKLEQFYFKQFLPCYLNTLSN